VLTLCERPARLGNNGEGPLVDFWVQRRDVEEMLLIEHDDANRTAPRRRTG
jgi:hypothetical protein